jgi:hypothetical protein
MSYNRAKMAAAVLLTLLGIAAWTQADGTESAAKVKRLRVPQHGIQPQVVVDGKGVVHLIYYGGDARHGDIFYVRSDDEGGTFSRPLRVNSSAGSAIAIGNIRGAHLAVGKQGRVHVAWNGSGKGGRAEEGMLYARLNDKGDAFEPQRNVIAEAMGLDGGGSVAADEAGHVYVVWHAPQPGQKGEERRLRKIPARAAVAVYALSRIAKGMFMFSIVRRRSAFSAIPICCAPPTTAHGSKDTICIRGRSQRVR